MRTVADKLNSYLQSRFSLNEDKVVLSSIVNQDGSEAITEPDKVVLTLVSLQKEVINGVKGSSSGMSNRPVSLNLFMLVSTHFSEKNYEEGLKFLSAVLSYFQGNPVFTQQNTPSLDANIQKLTFDIENLDMQSTGHLWNMIGGKYVPSVLYKVRMINIDEGNISGIGGTVSGLGSN